MSIACVMPERAIEIERLIIHMISTMASKPAACSSTLSPNWENKKLFAKPMKYIEALISDEICIVPFNGSLATKNLPPSVLSRNSAGEKVLPHENPTRRPTKIRIPSYLREIRVRREKDVLRLEVAVDNVLAVEVLQCHQDLGDDEAGDPLAQSALPGAQDHLKHVAWKKEN